jgi:hypothetical protein
LQEDFFFCLAVDVKTNRKILKPPTTQTLTTVANVAQPFLPGKSSVSGSNYFQFPVSVEDWRSISVEVAVVSESAGKEAGLALVDFKKEVISLFSRSILFLITFLSYALLINREELS